MSPPRFILRRCMLWGFEPCERSESFSSCSLGTASRTLILRFAPSALLKWLWWSLRPRSHASQPGMSTNAVPRNLPSLITIRHAGKSSEAEMPAALAKCFAISSCVAVNGSWFTHKLTFNCGRGGAARLGISSTQGLGDSPGDKGERRQDGEERGTGHVDSRLPV